MAPSDTPGAQRAISETTQVRATLRSAAAMIGSAIAFAVAATAYALNLQYSVALLAAQRERDATEIHELRAAVNEIREWVRRNDRHFDEGSVSSARSGSSP